MDGSGDDPENQSTLDQNAGPVARPATGKEATTVAASPSAEAPTVVRALGVDALAPPTPPLERIGNYRLIKRLGRGGMGEVWLADHVENSSLQCAVKFIRPDQRHPGITERFQRERESLVRLRHEHIIKVHDLGVTDTGLSYLVMEYVAGQPLDAFCDQRRLTLRQRLELFLQVCRAVQHAHRQGLIHRDLKPANIVVTEIEEQGGTRPVAKVIDFGIARALETPDAPPEGAAAAPLDSHLTQTGAFIGSVLYASPEQLLGKPVDTRADVYALGKILYQLLSGTLPITPEDLKTMLREAREEVWQRVANTEIKRPSTKLRMLTDSAPEKLAEWAAARGVHPSELPPLLTRELDWIALRALAGEPDRRYPSVETFAADLERYLRDEVIEARPPEWSYRVGKFWRRHRAPLTAAALIVASLVTALVVSVRYEGKAMAEATRANEEKGRAETEKQRAEKLAVAEADQRRVAEAQQKRAETSAAEARENLARAEAARTAQREQLQRASRLDHVTAEQLFAEGRWPQAVAYLAHALELDPENTAAGIHLWQAIGCDRNPVDRLPDKAFVLPRDATRFSFSSDGKLLAAATENGRVDVFDVLTGQQIGRSIAINLPISLMTFSRSGRWLVVDTQAQPGEVCIIDRSTEKVLPMRASTLLPQPSFDQRSPSGLRFSPDESILITREVRSPELLRRWRLPSGTEIWPGVMLPKGIAEIEWSNDNKKLVVWSDSLGLYAIEPITGHLSRVATPALKRPCAIRFDGKLLAALDESGGICVCDAQNGRLVASLPDQREGRIDSLHWRSEDGALIRIDRGTEQREATVIYPPESVRADKAKGQRSIFGLDHIYEQSVSMDGAWLSGDLEEIHSIHKGLGTVWIPLSARHVDVWLQLPGEDWPKWCIADGGRRLSIVVKGAVLCSWEFHDLPPPETPMAPDDGDRPDSQPVSPDGRWESEFVGLGYIRIREVATKRWVTNNVFWNGNEVMPKWHPSGRELVFESADRTANGLVVKKSNPTLLKWPFVIPQRGEPWLSDLASAACGFAVQDSGGIRPVSMADRVAARERLRKLKLDGPAGDVKDSEWARLLKWWLLPFPDRPPFP